MSRQSRVHGTPTCRTLLILLAIDDDLEPAIKNALAIRNAASTTGTCPDCGATAELYRDPQRPSVYHGVFRHESHCRAVTNGAAA